MLNKYDEFLLFTLCYTIFIHFIIINVSTIIFISYVRGIVLINKYDYTYFKKKRATLLEMCYIS